MRKITHLLCIIALALMHYSSALAAESGTTVTRTISAATGAFAPGNVWSNLWTSTETNPVVYLRSDRNNMKIGADGTGLDLREGLAKASVYTITTDGAWRVSGFEMQFIGNNADNPVTVTSGSVTLTSSATEVRTLTVTDLDDYQTASFSLTGNNQGITTTQFTVTLEPVLPEEYIEAEITIDNGEFIGPASGKWRTMWRSEPADGILLYLSSENTSGGKAANMILGEGGIDLREGSSKAAKYILSTAGSWRVSGFELTFRGNDADNPVTVSAYGNTVTSDAGEDRTLLVETLPYGEKASFTLEGNNKGITTGSFKVRLTPMSPDKRGVIVFNYHGSQPYATVYRIPAIAYIPAGPAEGRIFAVNDFRPCGSDIGYGEVDLHISSSTDGGYNWTFPADPVDADGNHVADGDGKGTPATSNENRDCGFGDPSIVADRETGELLMMGVSGRVPIGQATRAIPQGLAIWHSSDGGDTWTPWRDITEDILTMLDNNCQYGAVDGLFFTAGRMVQSRYVKVGSHYRVYVVGGGRSASIPDTQCWVFYSDDFGRSWHILGDPYKPALTTGGSEPKCEELPDGSVLYSGRAGGGRTFNIFTYTDYATGAGSWDNAVFSKMVTGAASCNGDALIIPVVNNNISEGAYLLLQSIPQHPSSRINVGINYKVLADGYADFGSAKAVAADWDGSFQATALPSAYSSLALLPDGTLGFIYEERTYGVDYCEVFRRLSVEQITQGAYSYREDDGYGTALEMTASLVEGKRMQAHADYPERTELLEHLDRAAKAFNETPSDASYLHFNAVLAGVAAGVAVPDDPSAIDSVAEDQDLSQLPTFDLQGREVRNPGPGLYICGNRRILIR